MKAAIGVYDTFKAYTTKTISDADWSIANPDGWRLVVSIEKLLREGTT